MEDSGVFFYKIASTKSHSISGSWKDCCSIGAALSESGDSFFSNIFMSSLQHSIAGVDKGTLETMMGDIPAQASLY